MQGVERDELLSSPHFDPWARRVPTLKPGPVDLNRFLGESGVPRIPVLPGLVVFFREEFLRRDSPLSGRALTSSKEMIPYKSSCLPSPCLEGLLG